MRWFRTIGVAAGLAGAMGASGPPTALAANYYVASNGSDAGPGNFAVPFATLQRAADVAGAGDTVFVRAGNYPEDVSLFRSGSATLGPITFTNYAGEDVRLNPGSFRGWNCSHVVVRGFRVLSTVGETPGIEFLGTGGFLEIRDNEVTGLDANNTAAVRVGGFLHDFVIDGNHVHHNDTGNQEAIRVHEHTRDFAITNNEVNDNANIGIDVVGWSVFGKPRRGLIAHNHAHHNTTQAPFAAGIYLDGPDSCVVEYNVSSFSEYGFQIACEPAADSSRGNVMRYNVAYGNALYGLGFGGFTGADVFDCQVHNNVFYDNGTAIGFWTNAGHDNAFFNNVLVEPAGTTIRYLGTPTNTVIDYNCYFAANGPQPGAHSIFANPRFASVAGLDFRLTGSSPCVDAGDPSTPAGFDSTGSRFPQDGDGQAGPRADIGAFEFSRRRPWVSSWRSGAGPGSSWGRRRSGKRRESGLPAARVATQCPSRSST